MTQHNDGNVQNGGDIVTTQWDIPVIDFSHVVSPDQLAAEKAAAEAATSSDTTVLGGNADEAAQPGNIFNGVTFDSFVDDEPDATADEASAAERAARKVTRKRRMIIAGAIAAVVALAASTMTWVAWDRQRDERELNAARVSCEDSLADAKRALGRLQSTLTTSTDAQAFTADRVTDAATLDVLKSAVDEANAAGTPEECSAATI